MHIYDIVKETMKNHKNKIELFQWATMSGVASLVYSEYISNMKQRQTPVRQILVPSIKTVEEFLRTDSQFMEMMSHDFVEKISQHDLIKKFSDAPELVLFQQENIEILKTVFDLYMMPNIQRRLPETIAKKFSLNDPNNQLIRQDRELDLFHRQPVNDDQFAYIVEETVLQMLMFIPTMKKEIEIPQDNRNVAMTDNEVLSIDHDKALCPIHINPAIIQNNSVIKLLEFVTSTNIHEVDISGSENVAVKGPDHDYVTYNIETNAFNVVTLTRFIGIEVDDTEGV